MTTNVIVVVERQFDVPRSVLFKAWTDPEQFPQWRGSPGWHVEPETATNELRLGGRHHHVTVRDDDPSVRVTTDAVFTEFFDPDVFVARQRITGDPQIDPNEQMELRVEFTQYGHHGTLLRIVQGPYEPEVAVWHGQAWEQEVDRLQEYVARTAAEPGATT